MTRTMTGVILFSVLYMGMLRFCRLMRAKATFPTYSSVTGMSDHARCLCTAGMCTYPVTCTGVQAPGQNKHEGKMCTAHTQHWHRREWPCLLLVHRQKMQTPTDLHDDSKLCAMSKPRALRKAFSRAGALVREPEGS